MAFKRGLLASLTAGLLLASASLADDDLLDRAKREQEVAKQAFERQVQDALAKIDKEADAVKAEQALRELLQKIDDDTENLSIVRRATLRQGIKDRLEKLASAATAPATKTGKKPAPADTRDDENIRSGLDQISELRRQGKTDDAQKAADALARRYPNHNVVNQVRNNLALADRVRESSRVAKEASDGTRVALNDVSRSATPIPGNIQYPSNWAEIDKRKEKYGKITLTEKEQAILKSLASLHDERVELKEMPLEKVLEYLQKLLGLEFRIDKKAIDELSLTYETPISVSLPRGLTKRTIMRRILNDIGLTYIIKEERMEVTSVERANKEITTVTYQIDDLLGLNTPTTARIGSVPAPGQMDLTVKFLIDLIVSQVEPHSWEKNGGPGSITYFAATRTLIVRNTAEVHALMGFGSKKKK